MYSADAEIPVESQVLATEDDLAVLRITASCQDDVMENIDYYVYQADDGTGRPSLHHLPRPPCRRITISFDAANIGILRPQRSSNNGNGKSSYIVAGLVRDEQREGFVLYLFDSEKRAWTANPVSLNHQQKQQYGNGGFLHTNRKVIAIGGDAGTMAFVDLWRRILFCDVLPATRGEPVPPLRYVPLPTRWNSWADARNSRDIALVNGRIKFVHLRFHTKVSKVFRGHRLNNGWVAVTWSRAAATCSTDVAWCKDSEVDSNHLNFTKSAHLGIMPKVFNDEDMPLPPFKRLEICRPTLGLHDDGEQNTVYIMAKINRADNAAWVIAVDTKDKTVKDVSRFAAERTTCITFTYMHSRISKYLKKGPK